MPNLLTKAADEKVAATPIKAHSPLKPPITDGCRPVKQTPEHFRVGNIFC